MPLVRIDHSDARSNSQAISEAIHDAIVEVYGIPVRDRFQVITSRSTTTIIAEDAGLGFDDGALGAILDVGQYDNLWHGLS